MATLTITSNSGAGTATRVLTYPGPDAQRIFDAWTAQIWNRKFPKGTPPPTPTHQDFVNYLADMDAALFKDWVNKTEVVVTPPTPPDITG